MVADHPFALLVGVDERFEPFLAVGECVRDGLALGERVRLRDDVAIPFIVRVSVGWTGAWPVCFKTLTAWAVRSSSAVCACKLAMYSL